MFTFLYPYIHQAAPEAVVHAAAEAEGHGVRTLGHAVEPELLRYVGAIIETMTIIIIITTTTTIIIISSSISIITITTY